MTYQWRPLVNVSEACGVDARRTRKPSHYGYVMQGLNNVLPIFLFPWCVRTTATLTKYFLQLELFKLIQNWLTYTAVGL